MPAAQTSEPATILVVDDNQTNLALAEAILQDEGYRTLCVASGEAALQAFDAHTLDCILLDAHMPGINGFEVCARIREKDAGREIPILFLTAVREIATFDAAQQAGADDFLTKPVRPAELAIRVRTAMRLRQLGTELREHYQLVRQQRDDLMRLQLQKERLTAFVVHDLKNPVNIIDLHAQLLIRDQSLPEKARTAAHTIRAEARSLNRLILNLLDITRRDEGQLHANIARVEMHTIVEAVVNGHQQRARAERISLLNDVPSGCTAQADADLLNRLLDNLVDNALRHAPADSTVRLTAERNDDHVELRVSDEGRGIPASQRKCVFEPHVRLNNEVSSRGHGLGLAFCKAVADAHAGSIWVSDSDRGTVFCLRLPDARS